MGCCLSTDATVPSAYPPRKQSMSPAMEVETVKEVLSETTNPKPSIHHAVSPACQPQKMETLKKPTPPLALTTKTAAFFDGKEMMQAEERKMKTKQDQAEDILEEVAAASDVCSLSESVCVSTATNLTDDSGTRYHQPGHRGTHRTPAKTQSPSRVRSFSGEIGLRRADQTAKPQYRRSEQSPHRRNSGPVLPVQIQTDQVRSKSVPRRREQEPGEGSVRRSRSPGTTRFDDYSRSGTGSGFGRSPSARRTNPSPGLVKGDPVVRRTRKCRDPVSFNGDRDGYKRPIGDKSVSLDNPQVSLECFIFL